MAWFTVPHWSGMSWIEGDGGGVGPVCAGDARGGHAVTVGAQVRPRGGEGGGVHGSGDGGRNGGGGGLALRSAPLLNAGE